MDTFMLKIKLSAQGMRLTSVIVLCKLSSKSVCLFVYLHLCTRARTHTHTHTHTHTYIYIYIYIPYILESNPHTFYSFRGLKIQMRIRFAVESWILEK